MSTPHLLLDYDRAEDVPTVGEVRAGRNARQWLQGAPAHLRTLWADAVRPLWVEAIAERLGRAGYAVASAELAVSTNGWHGRVRLDRDPPSLVHVVALQLVCGSDPGRESCNLQRATEAEAFPALAARRLMDPRTWAAERPADEATARAVLDWLVRVEARGAWWLDRWQVLYQPNPARERGKGAGE